MQRANLSAEKKARYDGYANTLQGVGIIRKGVSSNTSHLLNVMSEVEAEILYSGDFIAAKMVDIIAEDMVREGFEFVIPDMSEDEIRKLHEYTEYNLCWKQKFQEAKSWARLYGGSAILLGVDDGAKSLAEPLNWEAITKFDYMTLFHCFELKAGDLQHDPALPDYGLPVSYTLQQSRGGVRIVEGGVGTVIHGSRLIRFDGCRLPRRAFERNGYWHDSVLNKRKQILADYSHAYSSASTMIGKISQAVMKMKGLAEIMTAPDGRELLQKRLDMLDQGRSLLNTMLIDMDETWEDQVTNLGGLPDALNKFEHRLVTYSEYPHTILLGEGPGNGLGDTGKSELRDYYDAVSRKQETQLKPQLKKMLRAMFLDKNGPTKGKEPDSWDVRFVPLWQESQAEILDKRSKQAVIDEAYIRSGVLSPEEVADSRFGSGEYNHDTTLVYDRVTAAEGDIDVIADTQDSGASSTTTAPGAIGTPATPSVTTPAASNKVTSAQESLNGAQVTSLVEVITQVANGQLPRASGVAIIKIAFALSDENAESIMGEVGRGFTAQPAIAGNAGNAGTARASGTADDDMRNLDR